MLFVATRPGGGGDVVLQGSFFKGNDLDFLSKIPHCQLTSERPGLGVSLLLNVNPTAVAYRRDWGGG